MAKIALTETSFSVIPEGTHVFQITKVVYKEDYGKMEITMKTKEGYSHIERYSLIKENGEANEPALNAFSFLAKTALQNFDLVEIDHEDIVGAFIKADVTHEKVQNRNDPSKEVIFCRLGAKTPADGFEDGDNVAPATVTVPKSTIKSADKPATPVAKPVPKSTKIDLNSILGK